jgi:hypothetical protein
MKQFITTFLILMASTSLVCAADVVTLNMNIKSEMNVKITGVYQTQKDSLLCKKTVFIDGSIERHPMIKDVAVQEVYGTGLLDVKIPVELNDACKNKLVGMGVKLSNNSPLFEENLTIAYQNEEPQGIQKILIGPSKLGNTTYYVSNTSTIKMGPKEVASLSVEIVNFDPLPPRR